MDPNGQRYTRGVRRLRRAAPPGAHGPGAPGEGDRNLAAVRAGRPAYFSGLVALRISADALSRFTLRMSGHGPHPDRQLSQKFRAAVAARCGRQDVRMMERDDRPNASCREYRSFDGPLPDRSLWRFPRIDEVELVRDRLVRVDKEA